MTHGRGRVRKGLEDQLAHQRQLDQLDAGDEGLISLARTLADAIDEEARSLDGSLFTVGSLAGRLAPLMLELRGRGDLGQTVDDDELASLTAALRDPSRPQPPDPS